MSRRHQSREVFLIRLSTRNSTHTHGMMLAVCRSKSEKGFFAVRYDLTKEGKVSPRSSNIGPFQSSLVAYISAIERVLEELEVLRGFSVCVRTSKEPIWLEVAFVKTLQGQFIWILLDGDKITDASTFGNPLLTTVDHVIAVLLERYGVDIEILKRWNS